MNLPIIMALVFLVTLGLGVSGLYFLVATPLARHKLKMRLTTPQVAVDDGEDGEPRDIVRRKNSLTPTFPGSKVQVAPASVDLRTPSP